MAEEIIFKDFLFNKFLEWEKTQPQKRSSLSAFARWLSENSLEFEVRQQNIDSWINGAIPKDYRYVQILAEKLGNDVYVLLKIKPPNPYKKNIDRLWEFLPEEFQKRLSEEATEYETKSISERISKASKPRKARKPK